MAFRGHLSRERRILEGNGSVGRTKLALIVVGVSLLAGSAYAQSASREDSLSNILLAAAPSPPLTPHVPATQQSESDADRVHAAALFAEGRLFFQREQFERALQKFERAYRYSHARTLVCEEIIPLAYRIGRYGEALRYLRVADESVDVDPFVMRRLAIAFTEQGQLQNAAWLYRRILRDFPEASETLGSANNTRFVTQFELGRLYFLMERYDEAAELFALIAEAVDSPDQSGIEQEAIEAVLERPDITYVVFAESFLHANQLDKAKVYFERAYEQSNDDAVLQFELARVAAAKEDFELAEQHLNRYIEANATDAGAQPYFLLRMIYRATRGEESVADNAFIERMKLLFVDDDDDISMGYVLAEQLVEERRLDEAMTLYNKLVRREPLLEAFQGFGQISLLQEQPSAFLSAAIKIVTGTGEYDSVQPLLRRAVDSPDFAASVIKLAMDSTGKPSNEERLKCLVAAQLAVLVNQIDSANVLFKRAAAMGMAERADVYSMWNAAMIEADRMDVAIKVLNEAIELEVDSTRDAEWHFYQSGLLAAVGDNQSAMTSAELCAKLGEGSPQLETRDAWISYVCDQIDRSRLGYIRFLNKWSDNYQSDEIRSYARDAYLTLSSVCTELGKSDEAVECLERVLDEFPGDIGAMNDLGYLWAVKNVHLQRAHRMITKAVTAEPQNAAYRDSLGWVLYRLGRYEEAVKELRLASASEVPDPIVLDHLGDALLAAGNRDDAVAIWQQAIKSVDANSIFYTQLKSKIKRPAE